MSNLIIVSGTNGVGKSTFGNYLKTHNNTPFINTNEFFKNMFGGFYNYGDDELRAGSTAIHKLQNKYFNKKRPFAVERILNNEKEINNLIDRAKSYDFKVSLVYIGINTIELSKKRIEQRHKEGGHNVESNIIKENLVLSVQNFQKICSRVDYIILYDNSKTDKRYRKLFDARDKKIHFQEQDLPAWSKPLIETINTKVIERSLDSMLQSFEKTEQNIQPKNDKER
jgi:predicted ABC-type ATPase